MGLTAYNGSDIPVMGKCVARINKGKMRDIPVLFVVADTKSPPILGLKTSVNLNLIHRIMDVRKEEQDETSTRKEYASSIEFLKEYEECFGELGCLPNKHHICIDPNIKPVINPSRRVPITLQNKLKAELDQGWGHALGHRHHDTKCKLCEIAIGTTTTRS